MTQFYSDKNKIWSAMIAAQKRSVYTIGSWFLWRDQTLLAEEKVSAVESSLNIELIDMRLKFMCLI